MSEILKILLGLKKCNHSKVRADVESGYCPDCGEYVENRWYLVRCKHCKIKRKAHIVAGNVAPDTRFCPNCGGILYEVEKLDKINFIDINFAVLKKEVVHTAHSMPDLTIVWVEEDKTSSEAQQKLIEANL